MSLTSRERVVAALNHQEADRVPIDMIPLYDFYINLKEYLSVEIEEDVKPSISMEVIPHPQVLNKLGVDIIRVKLSMPQNPAGSMSLNAMPEGYIRDELGVVYKRVNQMGGGSYFEVVQSPLENATLDDLEKFSWPDPNIPGLGEALEKNAKRLFEDTDLALTNRFGGPIIELPIYLMGLENWMMRAVTDPEFAGVLLDKITDMQISFDQLGIEACGKYLQILRVSGEDLGMQNGPLYSPKMFHELILPRLKRRWQAARQSIDRINPSVKIMLHSCGSIRKFIPDFIEAGIQVLDPVQPHPKDMDSFELKREFGEQLCFHGGIDIQQVLPFGTTEQVEEEVKMRLQAFARGGGYILAPAHMVQADTPPANIVAMCQAAQHYGVYPLSL
jgi:uroporphyrinogen decarboxylase